MRLRHVVATAGRIGERWAGIPGIEAGPGDRRFVVFFSGGSREPEPENTVYLSVSDDAGQWFADPVAVASPRDGTRAYDPTLWFAPTGHLWLIYNRSGRETAVNGVYARVCADPSAAAPAWSDEFRVGYDAGFSFRMNKPTVLSSGEWVMPVTHSPRPTDGWFAGPAQRQGVGISRDRGRTWTLHGAVEAPSWALENMIVECRDGTLAMYIRTGAGVLWRSVSRDRGLTWARADATTITNPGSRFYLRRLSDGDWLLINSPDPAKRTGIVASLSSDEGATWRGRLVLDGRDHVSYPDAALGADGLIYAVHDRDRLGAGEILLSVFAKRDVIDES